LPSHFDWLRISICLHEEQDNVASNQFRRRALLQGLGAVTATSAFSSLPTFGNSAGYASKGKNPEWEERNRHAGNGKVHRTLSLLVLWQG
jgi:hypothetical protein